VIDLCDSVPGRQRPPLRNEHRRLFSGQPLVDELEIFRRDAAGSVAAPIRRGWPVNQRLGVEKCCNGLDACLSRVEAQSAPSAVGCECPGRAAPAHGGCAEDVLECHDGPSVGARGV